MRIRRMILSIRKAFSLTELLVVLVIVAVLFMASLPVVTKRKANNYLNSAVWNFVEGDENRDSYFHIGNEGVGKPGERTKRDMSASAFIGTYASDDKHAKLVIRSNSEVCNYGLCKNDKDINVQRQIQFRYGPGNGTFAGTLFADKYNLLLGGRYDMLLSKDYRDNYNKSSSDEEKYYNKYNTVLGINTADNLNMLGRSTIIGNNSLSSIYSVEDFISDPDRLPTSFYKNKFSVYKDKYATIKDFQNMVAIGNNVYSRGYANLGFGENHRNLFVGHNSGGILNSLYQVTEEEYNDSKFKPEDYMNKNNTVVGYNALSSRDENRRTLYQDNVILGANTGGYYRLASPVYLVPSWSNISRNVFVGSTYKSNDASDNVIIGYGAYDNNLDSLDDDYRYRSDPDIKYLTAIGNGACNSVESINKKGVKFPRTCIGVGAGQYVNEYFLTNSNNYKNFITEGNGAYPKGDERIYIGGPSQARNSNGTIKYPDRKGFFSGRSPLEVHNVPEPGNDEYVVGPSVVLNTHLVVRGIYYNTVGDDGNYGVPTKIPAVTPHYYSAPSQNLLQREYYPNPDEAEQLCIFRRTVNDSGDFAEVKNAGWVWPYDYFCHTKPPVEVEISLSDNLRYYDNNITSNKANSYIELMNKDDSYFPKLKDSDIRLKTDISENNDGLDKLLQLKPYNYTYKADLLGIPQVGVIAQDLQKIFPNSVTKGKDGFLRIRWDEMFYAMINAIKTLGAKIEKIASDISGLEISTLQVKNQHKALKKEIVELNARAARLERK